MTSASCLVTSSPEFEDPEQTPPELIAATAKPELQSILVIPAGEAVTFSAEVRSAQDLGEDILVKLYVDYGVESAGQPFTNAINGAEVPVATAGQPRTASVRVSPNALPPGCHTFTLMVSHAFDQLTECPEDLDDSSHLTWHALVCDATGPCPPPLGDPRLECPVVEKVCPEVPDEQGAGGGGGGP